MFLEVLILAFLGSASSAISCTSIKGDTPWFMMIKPPKSSELIYADKSKPYLTHHDFGIRSQTNPVALTMKHVYNPHLATEPLNYFMFNDAIHGGSREYDHGHTKGTVLFDKTTIVYIIHSTPRFPFKDTEGYGYPFSGIYFGQNYFCITMPISELSKLAYQIRMMWPNVYNYKIEPDILASFSDLRGIVEDRPLSANGNPHSNIETLVLVDNTTIDAYNKNGTFGADIYDALISPRFDPPMNLYAETWQHGLPWKKLDSNCTQTYFVKNVKYMNFPDLDLDFKQWRDHSKWAISADDQYHYLCFGGVNRMSTQFSRGGGAFCFFNDVLWNYMLSSIGEFEECEPVNNEAV